MELTVVIVNYNVKRFLEQCLRSVCLAMKGIDGEIIVVDNNSADGSTSMVRQNFPDVRLIQNDYNAGFSKANNQALRIASGKYCLLLNPDTLVQDDSFRKCIDFMESHPEAGALGVKMIDGKGRFQPESRRSLPEPMVAFFKISGLSALFPRNKSFGRYNLSYLDPDTTSRADVISGAYMFIRRDALLKTGLLDEDFFMYGEDIDLSYRLIKHGYTNYYYPGTTIIHYKGESTRKGSLNYVILFYRAMIIFAGKHFSGRNARMLKFIISFAIFSTALLSVFKRIALLLYQPLADLLLIIAGFYLLTPFWGELVSGDPHFYPAVFYRFVVPAYAIIWVAAVYFAKGYEKPVLLKNLLAGLLYGTVIILVLYALLPSSLRFSRALILLGSAWSAITMILARMLLRMAGIIDFAGWTGRNKRIVIVGREQGVNRVYEIYKNNSSIIGNIYPDNTVKENFMGTIPGLRDIVRFNQIDSVIFCGEDVSWGEIIRAMSLLAGLKVDFKVEFEGTGIELRKQ